MEKIIQANLNELENTLAQIEPIPLSAFMDSLKNHPGIYIIGQGRSGLVMDMFAIRLMHLGFNVHVIGEPTTPAIGSEDLLVIGSGSGKTEWPKMAAVKAHTLGATVALISAVPHSPISEMSDVLIVLPSDTKYEGPNAESFMLAGTLFEQSLLIFCDCVCKKLADNMGKTVQDIMKLHANIE